MCQQNHTYLSLWRNRRILDDEHRRLLNGFLREAATLLALSVTAFLMSAALLFYGFAGVSAYLGTQILLVDRPLIAYAAVSFVLFIALSMVAFIVGGLISMIIGGWRAHRANSSVLRGALLDGLLGKPAPWFNFVTKVYAAILATGSAIGLVYHLNVTWGWNITFASIAATLCVMSLPGALIASSRLALMQINLNAANERAQQEPA